MMMMMMMMMMKEAISTALTTKHRIVAELGTMWNEVLVGYSKLTFPGETEENHERSQSL
jgi:hypothetical protein